MSNRMGEVVSLKKSNNKKKKKQKKKKDSVLQKRY